MSNLFVVRHGQASFYGPHYDQLSPLGYQQAKELGKHWAAMGKKWDFAYIGPKQRHLQTATAVATAYSEAGMTFPELVILSEFDEHHAAKVVKAVLSKNLATEGEHTLLPNHIKDPDQMNEYFKRFQEISIRWVSGQLEMDAFETWQCFRERVEAGLRRVMHEGGRGSNSVVFSSAGPVAVTTAMALGLGDKGTMALSWKVRNGATTECMHKDGQAVLVSHNATAFVSEDLNTMI